MKSICIALVLALAARTAAAEPPLSPGDADPDVALGLSIGTTAVGVAMMGGSFALKNDTLGGTGLTLALVGPSVGHFYDGSPFTGGLGLRALGVGTVLLGFSQVSIANDADNTGAVGFMVIGTALVAGGTIWDIATARDHARDHNRERRLSLDPTALRGPLGEPAAGFALSGTF